MAAVIDYLDDLEIGVCVRANRFGRTEWIRRSFAAVSKLGDWSFWGAMGVTLFAVQGSASLPAIAQIAVTAGIGIAVYKVLKQRLVRERPFIHDGGIEVGTAPLDRYSFPSGHTLHAVSFTIMFTHVEPGLFLICAPFAVLVAASRVVLGLHYPSDVLVGALIGAALGAYSVSWM